jgi:tripartite-type tricarboxylate transporter receptor subunit TctC
MTYPRLTPVAQPALSACFRSIVRQSHTARSSGAGWRHLRDVTAHLLHDVPAAITDATPGAVLMARATVISASVAKKALPVTTLQELIDLIKKDPSKLSNGHGGVGATSHLRCLLFTSLIGARSPMIPYRGFRPGAAGPRGRQS